MFIFYSSFDVQLYLFSAAQEASSLFWILSLIVPQPPSKPPLDKHAPTNGTSVALQQQVQFTPKVRGNFYM